MSSEEDTRGLAAENKREDASAEPIILQSSTRIALTATIADKPINLFSRGSRNNFKFCLNVADEGSSKNKPVRESSPFPGHSEQEVRKRPSQSITPDTDGPFQKRSSLRSRGERRVMWKQVRGGLKKVEVADDILTGNGLLMSMSGKHAETSEDSYQESNPFKEEAPATDSSMHLDTPGNCKAKLETLSLKNFSLKIQVLDPVTKFDKNAEKDKHLQPPDHDDENVQNLSSTSVNNATSEKLLSEKRTINDIKERSSDAQPSTVVIVRPARASGTEEENDADGECDMELSMLASSSTEGKSEQQAEPADVEQLLFGGYEEEDQEEAVSQQASSAKPRRRRFSSDKYVRCEFCGEERLREVMSRHQRYSCKKCPHRVRLYSCQLCLFVTETLDSLHQHEAIHPPGFKPSVSLGNVCEVCSAEFDTNKKKLYHEWKVHDYYGMRVAYECEYCKKRFPTKWQHYVHVGYHTDRKNFMCDSCGKRFRSKQEVKDHVRLSHIKDRFQYQCQCCRIGLRTKEELLTHECCMVAELIEKKGLRGVNSVVYVEEVDEASVTEDGQPVAPRVFFDLESVTSSAADGSIRVSERYMCEYCGVTFSTKVQKFVHRKVEHGYRRLPKEHRTKTQLVCQICSKLFPSQESLRQHYEYTHSSVKKFPCSICGKSFKRLRDAQYHRRTIHEKLFKFHCARCGHGVHRKHYLKSHKCDRVHKGRKEAAVVYDRQQTKSDSEQQLGQEQDAFVELSVPEQDAPVVNSEVSSAGQVTPSDILRLLPASSQEQQWIIQENGGQILVIQAGLADQVEQAQEILVHTSDGDTAGAHEVAQICQAAAILSKM